MQYPSATRETAETESVTTSHQLNGEKFVPTAPLVPLAIPSDQIANDGALRKTFLETMRRDGCVLIRGRIPAELCEAAAEEIERDIGARLDAGSPYQEEPVESLKKSTRKVIEAIRDFVMREIMWNDLGMRSARCPKEWSQTLYGRLKRKNFNTPWHCDAFNTLIQRDLLGPGNGITKNDLSPELAREVQRFRGGEVDFPGEWHEIPIFTFWVPLRDVEHSNASHLRLHKGSHAMKGIRHDSAGFAVRPSGYRYDRRNFVGPSFEDGEFSSPTTSSGYRTGDVVIFHCFTQHEANSHGETLSGGGGDWKRRKTKRGVPPPRVSMDGRMFCMIGDE